MPDWMKVFTVFTVQLLSTEDRLPDGVQGHLRNSWTLSVSQRDLRDVYLILHTQYIVSQMLRV